MPGFAQFALRDDDRIDTTIGRYESSSLAASDGQVSTSASVNATIGKYCGDGIVQPSEACDPGAAGETAACNANCTVSTCGDSVVNASAGEECDPPDDVFCGTDCKNLPGATANPVLSRRASGHGRDRRDPRAILQRWPTLLAH